MGENKVQFFDLSGQPLTDMSCTKRVACVVVLVAAIANCNENFITPSHNIDQNCTAVSDFISVCYDDECFEVNMLQESLRKIEEIGNLQNDWNNNGAKKFSLSNLSDACQFVRNVQKQPKVFPTARDSIQFEYENERGDYLEFELFDGGRLNMYYCGVDDKEIDREVAVEEVNGIVKEFYGSKFC